MSQTFDEVKSVIVDVLKVDAKDVKPDTRFVEGPESQFHGPLLSYRRSPGKICLHHL